MAKTKSKMKSKPKSKSSHREKERSKSLASRVASTTAPVSEDAPTLTKEASWLLHTESNPTQALKLVSKALSINPEYLPAIDLAGEIYVELGEIPLAKAAFEKAVSHDPTGKLEPDGGTGPEKFLWLAQLCDEGGATAINWYGKGVEILRGLISLMDSPKVGRQNGAKCEVLKERRLKEKLVSALCGMAEIYMTDLCMEPDAEQNCEKFVTEALLMLPDSAEAFQTLASVRVSQMRYGDAEASLRRSFSLWKDLDPADDNIPSFATRITLSRLLIEVEMYEEAIDVLERLQIENDQIVDTWYLGGLCLYLLGEKLKKQDEERMGVDGNRKIADGSSSGKGDATWESMWLASRDWLLNCEQLYKATEWDDEPLIEHTTEILGKLQVALGDEMEEGDEDGDEEWEDEDEEMEGP